MNLFSIPNSIPKMSAWGTLIILWFIFWILGSAELFAIAMGEGPYPLSECTIDGGCTCRVLSRMGLGQGCWHTCPKHIPKHVPNAKACQNRLMTINCAAKGNPVVAQYYVNSRYIYPHLSTLQPGTAGWVTYKIPNSCYHAEYFYIGASGNSFFWGLEMHTTNPVAFSHPSDTGYFGSKPSHPANWNTGCSRRLWYYGGTPMPRRKTVWK